MAVSNTSPDEERLLYEGVCLLSDETLRDLKTRVDFIHEFRRGLSDREEAQYGWCVAIGVFAHDVG